MSHSMNPSDVPDRGEFSKLAVIIELGSYQIKIHDVRSDTQRLIPPVLLDNDDSVYGQEALRQAEERGYSASFPLRRDGFIASFEKLIELLRLIFQEDLEEAAVLLVESTPGQGDLTLHRNQRKELAKRFVEDFVIDAYFVAPQPLLALCNLERRFDFKQRNGTIIDIGHNQTRISLVYKGRVITRCCFHSDIAGSNFGELLHKELALRYHHSSKDIRSILRDLKENHLLVLQKGKVTKEFLKKFDVDPELCEVYKRDIEVNSSVSISVDKERFSIPEALFNPSVVTGAFGEEDSLPGLFKRTKDKLEEYCKTMSDRHNYDFEDIREIEKVLKRVFIVGGCSRIAGMVERIREEIEHILTTDWMEKNNTTDSGVYEEVRNNLGVQFYHRQENEDRGKESFQGALGFVESSTNEDWLYAIHLEEEPDLVLEKCPK